MSRFPYLIIGNSAGAVGAIETIRKIDASAEIGIISDEAHHVYSRPRISECITRNAAPQTIAYHPMDYYQQHGVTTMLGAKAVELDVAKKSVLLESGKSVGYDKLLLSTGANPARPPIPGIENSGVHFFTTFAHAEKLAGELADIRQAVVIGGGLIGLQAAEALSKVGIGVTVVEMLDRVLALAIDEHASALVKARFEEHGVTVMTSARVAEIQGKAGGGVAGVILADGTRLLCQAVVVATGVTPRTELALSAGIELNRGIPVDDNMQTSASDVYAAGDVAETRDFLSGEKRLIPIWPNAYMEGRTAGLAMAGQPEAYGGGLSMNAAHFYEFPLISAGMTSPSDSCTELLDSDDWTGYYRRIILKDNVPVGMVMAGDAVDRAGVVLSLIKNRTDVSPFLEKLAGRGFNNAHLPVELRRAKQLGKEKI